MDQATIEFDLAGDQKVTDQQIFQQLAQQGYQPLQVSADGQQVTMQDQQGQYQMPMAAVLNNLGMPQIVGGKPLDADYEHADPMWRALVTKLPDDDQRRQVLTQILQQRGIENPTLMGSGRDWHVYNPTNNSWIGMTNHPDWDKTDLVEAGLEIPRIAASGLAGGAATTMSGGNPLAGMAGAAAGGGAADALERGALAMLSPEYRSVVGQNPGANASDLVKNMAWDAAGMGAGKLAGKGLSRLTGGLAEEAAPISAMMRGGGAATRVGGELAHGAASLVDKPVGRELGAAFLPGLAEAQGVGMLAEAPAWLARKGAQGIGALGESGTLQRNLPRAADALSGFSERLLRNRAGQAAPTLMQRMSGKPLMQGATHTLDARNVMGNGAESITSRVRQMMGKGAAPEELRDALQGAYRESRRYGLNPAESARIGRQAAQDFQGQYMRATDPVTRRAGQLGEKAGEYMNLAEEAGGHLGRVASGVAGAGIKSVKGLGGLARRAGGAAEALGSVARPIETQAYGRAAVEGALDPLAQMAEEQWAPWRQKRQRATMKSTLAGR